VVARPAPDGSVLHSAVFGELAAGSYELYERPTGPVRLRLTVTGGAGPLGSQRPTGPGSVVLAVGPVVATPPAANVAVSPWSRNPADPLAGAKTTSYAGNVVALAWAASRRPRADEALFTVAGTGALSEGTGTNVFVAVDRALHTPSLATACLAGVTRALVLEALGNVVERDDLSVDELRRASEAFLTSSVRDVHPIAAVDGVALSACPGPLTRAAAGAFAALAAHDLDP
jgi:branched-chain amino acid aminotransferase